MARLDWSRLHSKILRSSIWLEDPMIRLVWICCLADSEKDGTFYGDYESLARAWNLKERDVKRALTKLCSPDPKSHTKTAEGRRIEASETNVWRVLNKVMYNPSGEHVGASTERVRRFRAKLKENANDSDPVTVEETTETGNDGNARNGVEEKRGEEKRREKRDMGRRFAPPTLEEVREFAEKEIPGLRSEDFWEFYGSKGWVVGKAPMKDWRLAARRWHRKDVEDGVVKPQDAAKQTRTKAEAAEWAAAQAQVTRELAELDVQIAERDRRRAAEAVEMEDRIRREGGL